MARKTKIGKAEKLNRAIERWERKQEGAVIMLRKSAEMLVKLRRQRKRMLDKSTAEFLAKRRELAPPPPVDTTPASGFPNREVGAVPSEAAAASEVKQQFDDDGDIPGFLRRGMAAQAKVDGIISEASKRLAQLPDPRTPEKRAARRAIERAHVEAELTGKRRRMPPSGKAALDAIKAAD